MKRQAQWTRWLEQFPANGRITFSMEEAVKRASGSSESARQALHRAAKDGWIYQVQRGLYTWVPTEYRKQGVPPFYWVLHAWMAYQKMPYYAGLLSAASLLGSAHQAPMEYQVVTAKQMRSTHYGKSRVKFVFRRRWPDARLLLKKVAFQDSILFSGPELTLVDLVKYPFHAAGWDNVATLARDLGNDARPSRIKIALEHEETPLLQRLGWLLKHLGFEALALTIEKQLANRILKTVALELGGSKKGALDERFRILVNYVPEVES